MLAAEADPRDGSPIACALWQPGEGNEVSRMNLFIKDKLTNT